MKWICTVCNYVHDGDEPPDKCPVCQAPKNVFEKKEDASTNGKAKSSSDNKNEAGGEGKSEYEKRSSIINDLACLKKELRIPIVLLAQINRGSENRNDKRPALSDLKSTGSLEEDADMVLLGHRPWIYSRDQGDEFKAFWDLAKHRGGPTRVIQMQWHPKITAFSDER